MSDKKINSYLALLQAGSLVVSVAPETIAAVVPRDPQDDSIVATAIAAGAEVICTLDRDLHHESVVLYCNRHKIEIVTDIELLHRLRPSQGKSHVSQSSRRLCLQSLASFSTGTPACRRRL